MALGGSFNSILAAARVGSDWAWARIYDELAPAVTGYLAARGSLEPADVASEVFLQVVRDLPTFEGDEPGLRAWVFPIAHRRLLDDRRYRARRPVEPASHRLPSDEPAADNPAEEAARRLSEERVRRILASLSQEQQSVLLLRVLGDLTIDQVAQVLGKSRGATKALQRRALAAVERELAVDGRTPLATGSDYSSRWTTASS